MLNDQLNAHARYSKFRFVAKHVNCTPYSVQCILVYNDYEYTLYNAYPYAYNNLNFDLIRKTYYRHILLILSYILYTLLYNPNI